jgi:DNA-binding NtrC family response regulator
MPNQKASILIIDDQPSVRFGLRSLLEAEGYRVMEAPDGEQALALLTKSAPQLILLDLRLPDTDGLDLLPRIKAIDDDVPVIILTAHGTIETAIRALKSGAENFLTKPPDADSFLILIARTLEQGRARRDRLLIGLAEARVAAEYFLGQSETTLRIHHTIERLAPSDSTVLLQGETGTGKGMMAHLIHRFSES